MQEVYLVTGRDLKERERASLQEQRMLEGAGYVPDVPTPMLKSVRKKEFQKKQNRLERVKYIRVCKKM